EAVVLGDRGHGQQADADRRRPLLPLRLAGPPQLQPPLAAVSHELTVWPAVQMPFALVWTTGYLIIILLWPPFVRKVDDRLQLFTVIELFLVQFCANMLVYSNTDTLDPTADLTMSVILIAITVGVLVLFIVMAGINLRKLCRGVQRAQAHKRSESIVQK